tara:strand:+ start:256 stop:483 length:228 start_codon:yes stop_codon:yes gene_type:complete
MKIFLNTSNTNNPTIEITQTYEVGVEVKPNPSEEPNTIKYVCYEVEATSEENARRKASDLCGEEFGHNPWTTEII